MRKLLLIAAAAGLALPAAPALADRPHWTPAHAQHAQHSKERRLYDSKGRYYEPRRLGRNDQIWRDRNGRYRCKRDNGTTGLVIGAAVGGLVGNQVAGRGDKTLGTIIGAVGGGVLGRAVDRGEVRCR